MVMKRYDHFLAKSAAFRKTVLYAFADGKSQSAIARKFNISRQRVNQIVRPKAAKARKKLSQLIRMRKLAPASGKKCADCGSAAKQYDHRDYAKPLAITPVCEACNKKRGRGKNGA